MSEAKEQPVAASEEPGDHDDHEPFDPEPARTLPPDEPQTPLWLPALGAALLLVGALGWALMGDGDEATGGGSAAASAKSAATASSRAASPPAAGVPKQRPAANAKPKRLPASNRRDIDRVRRELESFRAKQKK